MTTRKQVAEAIKKTREKQGITVPQAAKRASVSKVAWYKWEAGDYGLRVETLVDKVAPALKVPPAILLP